MSENSVLTFTFTLVAMETAIQLIQLYEANYPELLYRVFVVNGMKENRLSPYSRLSDFKIIYYFLQHRRFSVSLSL